MTIAAPTQSPYDDGAKRTLVSAPANIFILSDVRLYRDGLTATLARQSDFCIVGAAAPAKVTLSKLGDAKVSLLLLDATMPIGLDLVRELKRVTPRTKVVVFAMNGTDDELAAFAEAGVFGYVTRDASIEELIDTIKLALREELACSLHVGALLLRRLKNLAQAGSQNVERGSLTQREHEIAKLVDLGLSNKEIARTLRIELATVKNHVHNILDKLNVHRRGKAAARLREQAGKL